MAVDHLRDFSVVELRRYTLVPGKRDEFALYFESYFPEAFQQLGAIIFGQFAHRDDPNRFAWLRGYRDMGSRQVVCESFYDGPLWKEHGATMNDRLVDHTDVLLLRPLDARRGITVLPAVDPIGEVRGARGLLVAQIFTTTTSDDAARLPSAAEEAFAAYRAAGARETGVLATLDLPNNFPRHPVRRDGPHLLWLGMVENDRTLDKVRAAAERWGKTLAGTGLLRQAPELHVLLPTRRSRLRWL